MSHEEKFVILEKKRTKMRKSDKETLAWTCSSDIMYMDSPTWLAVCLKVCPYLKVFGYHIVFATRGDFFAFLILDISYLISTHIFKMVDSAWHQGVERANTTRPISAAFTLIEKKRLVFSWNWSMWTIVATDDGLDYRQLMAPGNGNTLTSLKRCVHSWMACFCVNSLCWYRYRYAYIQCKLFGLR